MSDTKKYLSPESLEVVREWVFGEQQDAMIQAEMWSIEETASMTDKTVIRKPDPEQVEMWTQKHAMLSGVLCALDELTESREVMKSASAQLDRTKAHLTAS